MIVSAINNVPLPPCPRIAHDFSLVQNACAYRPAKYTLKDLPASIAIKRNIFSMIMLVWCFFISTYARCPKFQEQLGWPGLFIQVVPNSSNQETVLI